MARRSSTTSSSTAGSGSSRSWAARSSFGSSRKSFIGKLTGAEVDQRLGGTIASNVIAYANGARMLRVHDVAPMRQALIVADAILDPDRASRVFDRRSGPAVHELPDQGIDLVRALVRHPVAGARDDLDAEARHPFAQPTGQRGEQRRIVLPPDHQGRDLDRLRGDLGGVLLRNPTRSDLLAHARGAVVVEAASQGARVRPGLVVGGAVGTGELAHPGHRCAA